MTLKRRAFRAIREVCGPEVCPKVREAERAGVELPLVAATAHQMRHSLAVLLMMAVSSPDTCPNCTHRLPSHHDSCSVARMLNMTAGLVPCSSCFGTVQPSGTTDCPWCGVVCWSCWVEACTPRGHGEGVNRA